MEIKHERFAKNFNRLANLCVLFLTVLSDWTIAGSSTFCTLWFRRVQRTGDGEMVKARFNMRNKNTAQRYSQIFSYRSQNFSVMDCFHELNLMSLMPISATKKSTVKENPAHMKHKSAKILHTIFEKYCFK